MPSPIASVVDVVASSDYGLPPLPQPSGTTLAIIVSRNVCGTGDHSGERFHRCLIAKPHAALRLIRYAYSFCGPSAGDDIAAK
jgi:hypothetical protein